MARGVRAEALIPAYPVEDRPQPLQHGDRPLSRPSRDDRQRHPRSGDSGRVFRRTDRAAMSEPDVVGRRADLEHGAAAGADRGHDVLARIRGARSAACSRATGASSTTTCRPRRAWTRCSRGSICRTAERPSLVTLYFDEVDLDGPLVRARLDAGARRDRPHRRAARTPGRGPDRARADRAREHRGRVGPRHGAHHAAPDDLRGRLRVARRHRDRRHQPDARRDPEAGTRRRGLSRARARRIRASACTARPRRRSRGTFASSRACRRSPAWPTKAGWCCGAPTSPSTGSAARRAGSTATIRGRRSMRGLFVAAGPAFKAGAVVPAMENVNVYRAVALGAGRSSRATPTPIPRPCRRCCASGWTAALSPSLLHLHLHARVRPPARAAGGRTPSPARRCAPSARTAARATPPCPAAW